jgi:hypothetical protein
MSNETIMAIGRHARWAFMAAISATMLAATVEQARRGLPALPVVAVYALTVGFGLEFLRAEWPHGRARVRADRR